MSAQDGRNQDEKSSKHCRGSFYLLPVLPVLSAYTGGIIAGRFIHMPRLVCILLFIASGCALLRVLFLIVRGRPACLSPLALFFMTGLMAVSAWQPGRYPPADAQHLINSGTAEIRGTIIYPPEQEKIRTICILDDLKIKDPAAEKTFAPGGRIRLCVYGSAPKLYPGDRILFQANIREFKNFRNSGGFDYRQYMADRNVWGNVYCGESDTKKLSSGGSIGYPGFLSTINRFRDRLDKAVQATGRKDSSAVLSALVVGKTNRISQKLRDQFSRAGASHLLAISGLHLGIVAACAFLLLRYLLSRSRTLLLRGWSVPAAALLALIPVSAYAMISGMSPSTQRAGIMVALFLFAHVLGRPYHPANTLAAAALFILAVYPPALFSVSFQLSFAAVSAIFFGLRVFFPVYGFLSSSKRSGGPAIRVLKTASGFVLVSVFAIAGTMPLVVHYFNQASLTGIVSNLILIPWIGFAVVPAGLVSALIFPFSETIGTVGLEAAGFVLAPAITVISAIADIPFLTYKTVTPSAFEVICIYLLMIFGGLWFSPAFCRHRKKIIAAFCAVALASAADAGYWVHRRFMNQDLKVTVMDVGHGHASLLELPGGRTCLIDGGGFSDNTAFDVGRLIVAPFLWRAKIASIDTVILSHPDTDHLNGLLYVLENFRIGKVITGPLEPESKSWKKFCSIIEEKDITAPDFAASDSFRPAEGNELKILYPEPGADNPCGRCSGANNCSLVLRVQCRGRSIIFPGDIEKCAEAEIVSRAGDLLDTDVLIAPHHGSRTSSTKKFLEAADPDTVIIPARQSGSSGPSEKVLDRYKLMDCRVLRTDKNGAVRIRVDKNGEMKVRPAAGEKRK